MKIGNVNTDTELFFIIEEGQFNLGNFDQALLMIELASKTGASAIEFQLAYADDFYIKSEPGHQIYTSREFTDEQLIKLVRAAKDKDLYFVATCLSHRLVEKMANFGVSAFNLNASDINNSIILDNIIDTGLPFFVSSPLATQDEIAWAVNRIAGKGKNSDFAILHGQHTMASGHEAVSVEDTSLGVLRSLQQKYRLPVGFIDHTSSSFMPAVAVAAGAQIISKHMSPSKLYQGPDWQICLEPAEMKRTIEQARDVFKSMRVVSKELARGEDLDRSVMRRSIVSNNTIAKGASITWDDISFKRPGTGIPPNEVDKVIGKRALVDIPGDSVIDFKMVN